MRRRGLIAIAVALAAGVARAGGAEKERADPPPQPAPVTIGAVRFEAPLWGRELGLPHNGGWVIAYDVASGARLWTAQVYGLLGSAQMEQDKREVFIVALRAEADQRHLRVTDERGRRWRLDVQTRAVKPLRDRRGRS